MNAVVRLLDTLLWGILGFVGVCTLAAAVGVIL